MTDEYRADSTVMLSMCDHSGRLSVTGTLDLFMDIATLHEEASGFGVFTMKEKGLYWIIGKNRVRYVNRPALMDGITVRTWFMEPTRLYGNREYLVTDRKGEVLITGETEWLVATEGLERLVSVKDYVKEGFYKKDGRLFGDRMKKIDKSFTEDQLLGVYRVSAADTDFVGHMNNAAYSRVIMSFVPGREIDERDIREAELFYALQCKEGDEISVYRRDIETGAEFGAFLPDGRNVLTARLTYER